MKKNEEIIEDFLEKNPQFECIKSQIFKFSTSHIAQKTKHTAVDYQKRKDRFDSSKKIKRYIIISSALLATFLIVIPLINDGRPLWLFYLAEFCAVLAPLFNLPGLIRVFFLKRKFSKYSQMQYSLQFIDHYVSICRKGLRKSNNLKKQFNLFAIAFVFFSILSITYMVKNETLFPLFVLIVWVSFNKMRVSLEKFVIVVYSEKD